jgi:hypothetical protein
MTLNVGFMKCLPKELREEIFLYLTYKKRCLLEKIYSSVREYDDRIDLINELPIILRDDGRLIRIKLEEIWDMADTIIEGIDQHLSPKPPSRNKYTLIVDNLNTALYNYEPEVKQLRRYSCVGKAVATVVYGFLIIGTFVVVASCVAIYHFLF